MQGIVEYPVFPNNDPEFLQQDFDVLFDTRQLKRLRWLNGTTLFIKQERVKEV